MSRPLVRWTMGAAEPDGYDCLEKSVSKWRELYGDTFDLVVCHNGQGEDGLDRLGRLGVCLAESICPPGVPEPNAKCPVAWKLMPPRYRLGVHEVLIDNDLVVTERLEEVDEFLASRSLALFTQGWRRNLGRFARHVPKDVTINSGFMCLPPDLNLRAEIAARMKGRTWGNYFDEQGLMASILCAAPHRVIPTSKIGICHNGLIRPATHGRHFVGLNTRGNPAWDALKDQL